MGKLFDEEGGHHHGVGYMDGFRFGVGIFVAHLLGLLVTGGVVWLVWHFALNR